MEYQADPFDGYEIADECLKEMSVKTYQHNQFKLTKPEQTFKPSEFKSNASLDGFHCKGTRPIASGVSRIVNECIHTNTINRYGEDTVMRSKYTKGGMPTLYIIGVLDGHGNNAVVSCVAAHVYDTQFAHRFNEVTTLPFTDHYAFKGVLREISSAVEDAVYQVVERGGGCTATIIGIIENGQKRVVFNMNMGDSDAYMRRDGICQHISIDHSVDNLDAYADYCAINRHRGIEPTLAVYNRINCDVYGSSLNGCYNHEGKVEPIPIFDITDSGCISINTKARNYIRKFTEPGGAQSIKRFVGVKNGVLKALPGYEHTNHGSTLMGDLQFVRGHGNLRQSRLNGFLHVPDITIYSINPEENLEIVCGSDGLWDMFWTHEVMDLINDDAVSSTHNIKKAIIDRSRDKKYMDRGYYTHTYGERIRAMWDDVSFVTFVSPGIAPNIKWDDVIFVLPGIAE